MATVTAGSNGEQTDAWRLAAVVVVTVLVLWARPCLRPCARREPRTGPAARPGGARLGRAAGAVDSRGRCGARRGARPGGPRRARRPDGRLARARDRGADAGRPRSALCDRRATRPGRNSHGRRAQRLPRARDRRPQGATGASSCAFSAANSSSLRRPARSRPSRSSAASRPPRRPSTNPAHPSHGSTQVGRRRVGELADGLASQQLDSESEHERSGEHQRHPRGLHGRAPPQQQEEEAAGDAVGDVGARQVRREASPRGDAARRGTGQPERDEHDHAQAEQREAAVAELHRSGCPTHPGPRAAPTWTLRVSR